MMNKKQVVIITGIFLIVALSLGMVGVNQNMGVTQANAQTTQSLDTSRTVSVSGKGEIQATPDVVLVNLGVQTEAASAQEALNQNNTLMQQVVDALKAANVSNQDIQTLTIQLSPNYQTDNTTGKRTLTGYIASNIVQVRSQDLSHLGDLLDQSVAAGATNIENISFEVSDPSQYVDQARQAAIRDAQHKASQLASLTDTTLGTVLTIQESSQLPVPIVNQQIALAAGEAPSVPIQPGMISITVNVQVVWTLMGGGG
jgi:uncharacterized protein YggE